MPAVFLKRTLTWSIPAALIFMAFQYHDYGKINVYALAVTLNRPGFSGGSNL
jgi:hypothetical protein